MANYNDIKNAALIAPTTTPDLGSENFRYGNVFLSGNVNIAGTSITATNAVAPRITAIAYPGDDTAADIAGSQTINVYGSGFAAGATIYIDGFITGIVVFISSTQLSFTSSALTAGTHSLVVVNVDGASAIFVPGIQYSGVPNWSTAAGTLGTALKSTSVNISLAATGDAPVTYLITSGTLPSGITLNSTTGALSGTAPVVTNITTYNFTISAVDAQKQDTSRNFSLTIVPTYPPPTVEYLVVGSGGCGDFGATSSGGSGGGGGAGGYLTSTGYSVTPGSAITVSVAAGATNGGGMGGGAGSASSFGTIVAKGGGFTGIGSNGDSTNGSGAGVGGGNRQPMTVINTSTAGQGYPGGTGHITGGAGGGGGANAAGGAGSGNVGGAGGAGKSSAISGTSTLYAGGGGGAAITGGTGGAGGSAIGGAGMSGNGSSAYPGALASPGAVNTGSGGGGAHWWSGGGTGASGIVIIRYADMYEPAVSTTGAPTITVAGGYRVYKFTGSGSITF